MAQRHTDDGREIRTSPPGTPAGERERRAAEAPPGSSARAETDVTGWSPERDEPPTAREGRFHRAAQLRLAQPRTEVGAPPPQYDTSADVGKPRWRLWGRGRHAGPSARIPAAAHGPYGRDDRAYESPSGQGAGRVTGEQDRWHSLDTPHPPRDYRPWDRTGPGAEDPLLGRGLSTEPGEHETFHPGGLEPVYEEEMGPEARWREDQWRREAREWVGRPREAGGTSGEYSGVMGLGQGVPSREARPEAETGRRGRWSREPLLAREIMTRHVKSAHLNSSLREVARIMRDEDCGIVPVVDERGRLQGVLTDRDLVIRTLAEGRPPDTLHARDVMTDEVEAVTPDEDIHGIIALMGTRQVRRVPVVERDDRLVGIISMADIATRAHYDAELQEALDRISARRSFWSRLH
jgi:CBS domain-containing protein